MILSIQVFFFFSFQRRFRDVVPWEGCGRGLVEDEVLCPIYVVGQPMKLRERRTGWRWTQRGVGCECWDMYRILFARSGCSEGK